MRALHQVFIIAISITFQAIALNPAHAGNTAAGLALAQDNCARCHAIGQSGNSTHKDAPPFAEVVQRYPPSALAEALAEGINTGHPDMPEFVFPPEQIGDLITYLETLQ